MEETKLEVGSISDAPSPSPSPSQVHRSPDYQHIHRKCGRTYSSADELLDTIVLPENKNQAIS